MAQYLSPAAKEKKRLRDLAYIHSAEGRKKRTEYARAYRLTESGRACEKRVYKKYVESGKYKETHTAYLARTVEKRKEYYKKYRKNPELVALSKVRKKAYELTPKGRYATYKAGARQRHIDFDLSFDEFMSFWKKPCSYCGEPIETIGLDRVDSSKGYSLPNVVPCCKDCNSAKSDQTYDKFIDRCLRIAAYYNRTKEVV